ncbi:MAG: DNA polymerase domain-containing protein [Candidatus Nitrosopolaris sp.]
MIPTKYEFNNKNIEVLSIDFETRPVAKQNGVRNQIFAAGFFSNNGFEEAIHLEDSKFQGDEVKFIRYIVYKIQNFRGIITGWYLANSDLLILHEVCKSIGVISPVGFYEVPIPPSNDNDGVDNDDPNSQGNNALSVISYPYLKDKQIIDMYKVFHHNFIKNSVYPLKYRDLQLDTVVTGMLGYGKYVSESTGIKITGENVTTFPRNEQKKYVLRDAKLVIRLIERNNYEIFNILRCIAEISGLDFRLVCHAGVGKAWESIIYKTIQAEECSRPLTTDRLKKRRYSGGLVLEPEPKSYAIPIEVIDVEGLYPTVMMLHNLSFETVCCGCCRDNPAARVPQEIMDSINEGLRNKIKSKKVYESEKRSERYWICLKNRGAIPMMLAKFKQERDHYRALVDEPMSQALKVMMNSIYGLFGSDGIFEFQDYRVAELVTAFARVKLIEMKEIASKQFGMNIIYGDTDSIFVSDMNEERRHELVDSFIATCKQTLGVEVDHQNTFVRSILISKKHYIGIQPDGKVIIKGMEGKKRDRPPFFNQVFSQLIEDYRNDKPDLSLKVFEAFKQLEAAEVDPSLLAYSVVLNKDPDLYQSYTPQHKIGTAMNKEAGSLIKYYKTGQEEDGYKGYSTNYRDLNVDVYKEELWKLVKEILILQGYDIQKLEDRIFGEVEDNTVYDTSLRLRERQQTKRKRSQSNVQRNESLAKYFLSLRILNYRS